MALVLGIRILVLEVLSLCNKVDKFNNLNSFKGKRKITMLTAYDYPTAKVLAQAGVDVLLVGDSLGMVVLGFPDTKSVTLDDVIRHTGAVVRGRDAAKKEVAGDNVEIGFKSETLVIADLPVQAVSTIGTALRSARKLLEETGADGVKVEGNPKIIQALHEAGVKVIGHTGLKPQQVEKNGVRGRDEVEAESILDEALELEKAGAFALVLECVPAALAKQITAAVNIPVIGIGAGKNCDGQVLVSSDMLGLYKDFKPKFVRKYADFSEQILASAKQFIKDTESGNFPSDKESF